MQQGLADGFQKGLTRSARWEDLYSRIALMRPGCPRRSWRCRMSNPRITPKPVRMSVLPVCGNLRVRPVVVSCRSIMFIDERRDPYRSSDAAAALLKYNYSILEILAACDYRIQPWRRRYEAGGAHNRDG